MAAINYADEHGLQPFFILHKASQPTQSSAKARRKINSSEKVSVKPSDSYDEALCLEQRLQSFRVLWSNLESTIKDVLRNINCGVFDSLSSWIRDSYDAIYSDMLPDPTIATKTYPILLAPNHPTSSKQLPTAVVLTNNMEFVDDIQTFGDLAQHLKTCGYHVASLTSFDLSTKSGVVGCLRSLLKQFLTISTDAADISILASWYTEQGNHENPVVLIIDSVERCCRSVLSAIIVLLSEWAFKIPIILVFGIATTADALCDILPSNVLQYLSPSQFILESPTKRMDATIASLFVRPHSCLCLSHKVATFLRNNFLTQDGTLTAFIRALKIAGVLHFILDIPSFAGLMEEENAHNFSTANVALLQERMIKQAFGLPSHQRDDKFGPNDEFWDHGLSELQRMYNAWSSLIQRSYMARLCLYQVELLQIHFSWLRGPLLLQCLNEAGKYQKLTLLDLFCAVLEPYIHKSDKDGHQSELVYSHRMTTSTCCFSKLQPCSQECRPLCLAIDSVRDLPVLELCHLLKIWEEHTAELGELHKKIKELQSLMEFYNRSFSDTDSINSSKKRKTQGNVLVEKGKIKFNEKATELATSMARDHMQPIESIPLHEIICFKNVVKLQSGLMGEPRKRIQVDLLESQNILNCRCCRQKGSMPLPSVHDTSIMYSLCLEHGNLINVHDLFESFKARISQSGMKTKNRLKHSKEAQKTSDASIQARFCRAIIELQITGLLRTPSKRRPDYVQSIAFGV